MREQFSIGEEIQYNVSRCRVDYEQYIAVSLSGWGRHGSANVAAEYAGDEVAAGAGRKGRGFSLPCALEEQVSGLGLFARL